VKRHHPLFLLFLLPIITAGQANAAPSEILPRTKQVVAVLKQVPSGEGADKVKSGKKKSRYKYPIQGTRSLVFELFGSDLTAALAELSADPMVAKVYADRKLDLLYLPNDPSIKATSAPGKPPLQWNMFNSKFAGTGKSAWDISKGSASTVVAVIDSGIDSSHEDLKDKIQSLVDCTGACKTVASMTASPTNLAQSHGTHVAGILAAATDNAVGIAGSGFNSKMMVIKILDINGDILTSYFNNAIRYAADHGAKVINLSLGSLEGNLDGPMIAEINDSVAYAWGKGAVVVAAAGNCGRPEGSHQTGDGCDIYDIDGNFIRHAVNEKYYPAASPNVISVAALDVNNNLAPYSEYNDISSTGNWITIAAPGGEFSSPQDQENGIASTWPQNQYFYDLGTSMATPHVSGLAALILAAKPALSNSQVKSIIESSGNKSLVIGKTKFGILDALSALEKTVTTVTPTTVPPTISGTVKTGDANFDNKVDGLDYVIWRSHYNQNASGPSVGDFDNNGKVDGLDYFKWLVNYNT